VCKRNKTEGRWMGFCVQNHYRSIRAKMRRIRLHLRSTMWRHRISLWATDIEGQCLCWSVAVARGIVYDDGSECSWVVGVSCSWNSPFREPWHSRARLDTFLHFCYLFLHKLTLCVSVYSKQAGSVMHFHESSFLCRITDETMNSRRGISLLTRALVS